MAKGDAIEAFLLAVQAKADQENNQSSSSSSSSSSSEEKKE